VRADQATPWRERATHAIAAAHATRLPQLKALIRGRARLGRARPGLVGHERLPTGGLPTRGRASYLRASRNECEGCMEIVSRAGAILGAVGWPGQPVEAADARP